ncbi:MAG: DUF1287 domain-containing protein [Bulleidia sp.]
MRKNVNLRSIVLSAAAIGLIIAACVFLLLKNHASSARLPDRYDREIPARISQTDEDGDEIDDQTDILQSALRYTETHPSYQSRYYADGYPDDGCGVCTDLVAAALKGSGYDLRELVDQDIRQNPQDYEVETPDANIDYRRVKNLQVWFRNHAISCSMDLNEIEDWQGGDIVIFLNHIGIVSDHRNAEGIPYVIHHSGPFQRRYEEDILEHRDDLSGHYRIS